jgi:hypothetical protein
VSLRVSKTLSRLELRRSRFARGSFFRREEEILTLEVGGIMLGCEVIGWNCEDEEICSGCGGGSCGLIGFRNCIAIKSSAISSSLVPVGWKRIKITKIRLRTMRTTNRIY